MKNVFHYYFHEAFVKNLMKKLSIFLKSVIKTLWYFNKKILKFSLTSTLLQNVTIIHFLLVKWRFFQCNAKFKKKSILIAKFTKPLPNALWKWCYFLINFLKSQLHIYYIWQFFNLKSCNIKMFYDVKYSDTKLAMLSNIMQYLKKWSLL